MVIVTGKTNVEKQEENKLEKFVEAAKPLLSKKENISKGIFGAIFLKRKQHFLMSNYVIAQIDTERHKIYLKDENYLELTRQLANNYESLFGGKKWVIKTQYD